MALKKKINNQREFKTTLKRFLMENPFYSIDEFMVCDASTDENDF